MPPIPHDGWTEVRTPAGPNAAPRQELLDDRGFQHRVAADLINNPKAPAPAATGAADRRPGGHPRHHCITGLAFYITVQDNSRCHYPMEKKAS